MKEKKQSIAHLRELLVAEKQYASPLQARSGAVNRKQIASRLERVSHRKHERALSDALKRVYYYTNKSGTAEVFRLSSLKRRGFFIF